ncbi:DUF1513 domain-containing protein [Sneathiella limimaris]|uniref:DUF1513 domain-containing protein n=1 Tax=Sneathiella limimaris TaxID=1964213 RepID=UPI00146B4600|nr:DUF1513 domain-containing protein [Sneathiella limimaris]
MEINRRQILKGIATSSALLTLKPAWAAKERELLYLSSSQIKDRQYATVISSEGDIRCNVEIPVRGHGGAYSALRQEAVLFSRRPGNIATVISLKSNAQLAEFTCPEGRHFFGHGFYSPDGHFLFATENDYEADRSYLGVYEVEQGYRHVGQIDCLGIGAHQVVLMSDQRTAVVAIGGISTHPDYPRQKLNIPMMAPGLTYIDVRQGKAIAHYPVPKDLHKLSLRHLAEGPDKSIVFGCQYQGNKLDTVPLLGLKKWDRPTLEFVDLPNEKTRSLHQYIGSVMSSLDHSKVAISSPRGDSLIVLEGRKLVPVEMRHIADVCGVGPTEKGFVFSSGRGAFGTEETGKAEVLEGAWDNHLTPLI